MPVTLIKLGGSLLSLPDLPARLEELLGQFSDEQTLLLVGGGPTADVVRTWDSVHSLTPTLAHDLAIESLHLNQSLLTHLLPNLEAVDTRDEAAAAWNTGRLPLLNVPLFLQDEEPKQQLQLPRSWQATSDAIAAWVAIHWPAQRLVLAKSASLPASDEIEQAVHDGLVDACFGAWFPRLPSVDWVNLRDDVQVRQSWRA